MDVYVTHTRAFEKCPADLCVQVLYSLCLEVLDIPTNYTREMADEYMKLAELMTREHRT